MTNENSLEGRLKVTAFNGSPKGKRSNTNFLVDNFLKGAEEAGAETENIFVSKKKIPACKGCLRCWTKSPGECIHSKSDVPELLDKFINSDVVVLAAPVYVGGVPGVFKNFLDHLTPLVDPYFVKDGDESYQSETPEWLDKVFDVVLPFFDRHYEIGKRGAYTHRNRHPKRPKIVCISNSGLTDRASLDPVKYHLRNAVRNFNAEIVGELYKGQGELFRDMSALNRLVRRYYQGPLKKAGREVVEEGRISDETKERIEKPLLPAALYMTITNRLFYKIHVKRGLVEEQKIDYAAVTKESGKVLLGYVRELFR